MKSKIQLGDDDDLSQSDWDDLEEEVAKYHDPERPPFQRPPPVFPVPPDGILGMTVLDPRKELQDKTSALKQQIELEEEYQDLINQLQKLKTGKTSRKRKATRENPLGPRVPQGGVQRWPLPSGFSSATDHPEEEDAEAFPVRKTTDIKGIAWRHHTGFSLQIIKELKNAVTQYGANVPFTLAILESATEERLTPGDWNTLVRAVLSGFDRLIWKSEYEENCKEMARRNAMVGPLMP